MLRRIGEEALAGTTVGSLHSTEEFNRYCALDNVPAVALEMEGDQPSELVLSRASGRTLRRTDPLASAFHKAYLSVHVWQWGNAVLASQMLVGACLWSDFRPIWHGRPERWPCWEQP
jgi:hypothetical protein